MIVIDPSTLPVSPRSHSSRPSRSDTQDSPRSPKSDPMLSASPPQAGLTQPVKQRGRRKDSAWKEVIVADGTVSCRKCEKIIHHMGETHVECVRHHLQQKCTKRLKTQPITSCFPRALSESKIHKFQMQFALWFYSTGMAFHKVDHPALVMALTLLTPAAVVATGYQLTTPLLSACFERFLLKMMHAVTGKACTLTTDGWIDVNGNNVINYVLICGSETYFLESVYTGSTSHDAVFLAPDIKRVMAKFTYVSIAAVVANRTATNQLVWSTSQKEHPHVFFHGCISHVLHLAVKNLVAKLKWLRKIEKGCRKLVKFFKKNQQLWHELRRLQKMEGKNALVLPAATRWGTIDKCFVSIYKSEKILHAFVSGRDFLHGKTKKQKARRRMIHGTVKARDFVTQLSKAIEILAVLSKFQKSFECNTQPLSDVYRMFIQLPRIYGEMTMPISDLGVITGVLKDRFDFVYGDAHGVAYVVDPRYGGEHMDQDTREAVLDFIAV